MFVSYNLEDFGEKLKNLRTTLGFSQVDVQRHVGVSVDTIRKIESGRVIPRYDTLELLSVVYKEDLLELLKECRSNKFLMEFHDDIDYIITCYDKDAAANLKKKLEKSFYPDAKQSMVNPAEFKQFMIFVDAIDQFHSTFKGKKRYTRSDLIDALRLTLPDYSVKRFKRYKYNYIEFRILLLLSLFIAQEKNYIFSNRILYYILEKISTRGYSTQYVDFLTINVYSNIAYNYHLLDEHAKVIQVADEGISFCLEKRTLHALYSLYYRKGIAQFHLEDKQYLDSIATAFSIIKAIRIPKLLEDYVRITKEEYGISIPMFSSMEDR